MKKSIWGMDVEISDWTRKLKIITLVFSVITIISCIMTLFLNYTIPGLSPISLGIVMLLLGIRELNIYFKEKKSAFISVLGIILTLLFAFLLYIGIDQILDAVMKQIGF